MLAGLARSPTYGSGQRLESERVVARTEIDRIVTGTRSTGDTVGRFKTGAFRLAKLGQVRILPVGIAGTRRVLPKHERTIKAGRVQVL